MWDDASTAAQRERERRDRIWWAAWEREHPPPRVCICGGPGAKLWLTFLDERGGPRPYHPDCARYSEWLKNDALGIFF